MKTSITGLPRLLVLVLLTGCAARVPAPIEERDLAGEVRRETEQSQSQVEVYALSDPAGLHLLEQARVAEQAGQLDRAMVLVRQAIELTPTDPEYWQYLAELELQNEDFLGAIEHAAKSFELGPQIGPLCQRNWLTKQHAQSALGDVASAAASSQQAKRLIGVSRDILGEEGTFAARWPNFRPRDGQLELAEAIEQAIVSNSHVVAEAATGIGKTFAYLVPAISAGRKTIVSTGTRNLQDQLFHRDLPHVLDTLGISRAYKVALLKGRANYLCHYRLDQARGSATVRRRDGPLLAQLAQWSAVAISGDLADFPGLPEVSSLRPLITSSSDNCLGQNCTFFDECFVAKARAKAQKADLVVVNHHLLFADMALRREGFGEILPDAEIVIVDEAHKLPETARLFFGEHISTRQLLDLVKDSKREAGSVSGGFDLIRLALDQLTGAVRDFRLCLRGQADRGDWVAQRGRSDVLDSGQRLSEALDDLCQGLKELAVRSVPLEHCWRRSNALYESLEMLLGGELEGHVAWYEKTERSVQLNLTPLSVAEELDAFRLQTAASWIFTSATLAVGDRFELFAEAVGLDAPQVHKIASPFDYANQALMYLPATLPEPASPGFLPELVDAVLPVIEALRGRTLMLFTSHRNLRLAATLLADLTELQLLVQGEKPRHSLVEAFKLEPDSILLGAASFWEGIDVPGDALRCVIIDKLPFAAPDDPITRGRNEALTRQGRNPFREAQLPQAILSLKQGAGRLIRDLDDAGLLVVGDPIWRKRWHLRHG
nr:probable ATP-dependent DNA helicase HI_0387 [Nerophis lumbriciformis]